MHRAALMQFQSGFSHVFENCNFSPKVTILQIAVYEVVIP